MFFISTSFESNHFDLVLPKEKCCIHLISVLPFLLRKLQVPKIYCREPSKSLKFYVRKVGSPYVRRISTTDLIYRDSQLGIVVEANDHNI